MMKEEKEVSFFKKLIISIKDFEKYPELASKKWSVVLSYLVKLLAIFTIIVSCVFVYNTSKEVTNSLKYIKEELPEFTFSNNTLKFESNEPIIKENMENIFNTIIIDTAQIDNEKQEEYINKIKNVNNGLILLKDKALIKTNVSQDVIIYSYNTFSETYQITEFNKGQVLEYFSGTNLILIYSVVFLMLFIYTFILYFSSIWLDIVLLGALGFFSAIMLRLHLRFSAMCKIAIHSLTLPILLNSIIIVLNAFTGFEVKYFEVMYIGISYVYIITAILMIKSDIIKNQKELTKILEEQMKVREELERQKEEEEAKKEEKREKEKEEQRKKEKKDKKEKEGNLGNNEPQGENA